MLKLMQLSQVAEVVGETAVRDQIHEAVKAGLEDWFHFNGNPNDRHFAYNAVGRLRDIRMPFIRDRCSMIIIFTWAISSMQLAQWEWKTRQAQRIRP